jgi:hypothetical protein
VAKNFGVFNAAGGLVNMGGTKAQGYVQVEFTDAGKNDAGNNQYTFDASQSFVKVTRGQGTPSGNAANLIRDPWTTYSSVHAGDIIGGSLKLTKGDFNVNISDRGGEVMGSLTVGSDFPTGPLSLTSGPGIAAAPGLDSQGRPIVAQLGLEFKDGQLLSPGISLSANSSYQFTDPDTNAPISAANLEAYVTNRIDSALALDLANDPSGDTVVLTKDLTLFNWSGTAVQDGSPASVDIEQATIAQSSSVPEPGPLALSGLGLLAAALAHQVRARRRAG